MTQSVILFNLIPGGRDGFVETFTRIGVLETSRGQAGYRGGRLHVAADDADVALVTAQWDSPEAYTGWLENPVRETIGEQLRPFCAEEPVGRAFEVVHEVLP